ncbi:hypothetical protein [Bacillus haynesii]|uniref:hypothetical protein n=1 Tax=Bacillus haynesii TaxID=1925021 RepID=UPI002282901B|nr:hypothetical protein [Bacillus haynesii]MCY8401239.1 hypothetical protein [Bacillus haynesii]
MDSLLQQITELYEKDPVSSIAYTLIIIVAVWLYNELKKSHEKEQDIKNQKFNESQEACSNILKNYELHEADKINKAEFYSSIYESLSKLDKNIAKELVDLLLKNCEAKEIKQFTLNHINKLKNLESTMFSKDISQTMWDFSQKLKHIFLPVIHTIIILLFIFLALICSTDTIFRVLFIFAAINAGLFIVLMDNFSKLTRKAFIAGLVFVSLPIIVLLSADTLDFLHNPWIIFPCFGVSIVIFIIIIQKSIKD